MAKFALVFLVLLSACATHARKPAGFGKVREVEDIGSLHTYTSEGKVGTCTQLGLAIKDSKQLDDVRGRFVSLALQRNRCDLTAAIGKCDTDPATGSDVLIYSEIYYYAPMYTRGVALDICSATGGTFSSL